jgi:zinc-ribbon domain
MFCGRCGAQAQEGQLFCTSCGETLPAKAGPQALPRGRVARHLQVVGILWVIFSVFRLLPGLGLLGISRGMFPFMPFHFQGFLVPLMKVLGIIVLAISILGIVAGWALLERMPWARTLAIVVAIISLLHPPFGTALGIYTLWVLMPAESEQEFRGMARPA